ncbi:MAG: VTT domain-containing protein [Candidatus Levybacteria bacterium]|nr:VTT domain-containing protein [Candidatus Levybacteria bacterium]
MKNQKIIAILTAILSLALTIAFFVFKDYLKDASALGLLGIFLINAVSSATLFIASPAFLTVIAGGSIYPPILVALVASFGSASGDMLGFVLGSTGRKIIDHKLQKHLLFRTFEALFKRHGTWLLFLFALIPNPIFDSLGIFAGVLGYSWKKFFIIVFVGRFFRFLVFAYFGSRI